MLMDGFQIHTDHLTQLKKEISMPAIKILKVSVSPLLKAPQPTLIFYADESNKACRNAFCYFLSLISDILLLTYHVSILVTQTFIFSKK